MLMGVVVLVRADELAATGGRYVSRQFTWVVVSIVVASLVCWPNYRILSHYSYLLLAIAVGMLVMVFWFPPVNGSQRWIRIGPFGWQPSEFAKLVFVLGLARYLMYRKTHRELYGLLIPLGLVVAPMLLILREPDLGTSLVFLPVLFAMLFAAGARARHLAMVALIGLAILPILWSQMSREQRSRISALAEQTGPNESPTGDGYHLHAAKQRIALGGVWGNFWRTGDVEDVGAYRVPELQTDSVFCLIGEQCGLAGIMALFALFAVLIWRILAIAARTQEPFGRLVACGIAVMIAVQVSINTAMMVGLMPITGLTLPLVSYGGSSLLAMAIGLGLVINIGLRPGYEMTGEPFAFSD
jgi:cell division protein FtsW (lipid II flippase)